MAVLKQKVSLLYSDLDLSFTAHPVTGDVAKKIDVNAVKQAIKVLVLTNFYERPFQHKVAGNIRGFLFQPPNLATVRAIRSSLYNLLESYDKRVKIEEITVAEEQYDANTINIFIEFYILGIENRLEQLTINLERLR